MRRLTVFFVLALVLANSPLLAQADSSKVTMTLQGADKAKPIADSVLEEHIIRQVFDQSYTKPYDLQHEHVTQTKTKWPEWEDVYFNRDLYAQRLEKVVSEYWRMGNKPWQASIKVTTDEPLRRGGRVNFILKYPQMDFKEPWIITAAKADSTQLIRFNSFSSKQVNYPIVAVMMLVLLLVGLVALGGISWLSYKLYGWLVDLVCNALTDGKGGVWERRFAMCIVGLGLCFIFLIMWIAL